jgi:hypothetical protein
LMSSVILSVVPHLKKYLDCVRKVFIYIYLIFGAADFKRL